MHEFALVLAGILLAGAPLVLATLGETITEKAGVINLSLDGSMLLSAMAAFALCRSALRRGRFRSVAAAGSSSSTVRPAVLRISGFTRSPSLSARRHWS